MSTVLDRRSMLPRWASRLEFPEWFDMPLRMFDREHLDGWMRVEETRNKDHMVIRAEIPGIDPDKDVEITVADGLLTINAERREETKQESEGRTLSEFRYGSFHRVLEVPRDAKVSDVNATYKDGILTITVPLVKAAAGEIMKVPVGRA